MNSEGLATTLAAGQAEWKRFARGVHAMLGWSA